MVCCLDYACAPPSLHAVHPLSFQWDPRWSSPGEPCYGLLASSTLPNGPATSLIPLVFRFPVQNISLFSIQCWDRPVFWLHHLLLCLRAFWTAWVMRLLGQGAHLGLIIYPSFRKICIVDSVQFTLIVVSSPQVLKRSLSGNGLETWLVQIYSSALLVWNLLVAL